MKTVNKVINLQKYRSSSGTSYTGRPEGRSARKDADISSKDKDSHTYDVIIPEGTTAFNPSFFLGFFFDSIKELGIAAFDSKYKILLQDSNENRNLVILKDILEGKRHATNQIESQGKGFFDFF